MKRPLSISTPEAEGIPSGAIARWQEGIVSEGLNMHSLMVLRHGKIVYEAYFKPMDAAFRHRLYSCSKSFVSVALGLVADQGLLSIDDPVMKFFPERENVPVYLGETTLRDLLRMEAPYENGSDYHPSLPSWEDTFFTGRVSHEPGTVYSYCTAGTTILCDVIRRVTGKNFLEVLAPVFEAIGCEDEITCVETPEGIQWGGSGICMTPRDFAKFALLCMRYGSWEGKQLLPEGYMRLATSKQTDNTLGSGSIDQAQGYGYQFWMTRFGGFAFFGMGGQYAICLPKQDLVVVTTGYAELWSGARVQAVFGGLWREILPRLSDEPLKENTAAYEALRQAGDALTLFSLPAGEASPLEAGFLGREYLMDENAMGISRFRLDRNGQIGILTWLNETGPHVLRFGFGGNVESRFPERYQAHRISEKAEHGPRCFTSGMWSCPDRLVVLCQAVDEYLGELRLCIGFKGDTVTIHGEKHAEWFMDEYTGFASGKAVV